MGTPAERGDFQGEQPAQETLARTVEAAVIGMQALHPFLHLDPTIRKAYGSYGRQVADAQKRAYVDPGSRQGRRARAPRRTDEAQRGDFFVHLLAYYDHLAALRPFRGFDGVNREAKIIEGQLSTLLAQREQPIK